MQHKKQKFMLSSEKKNNILNGGAISLSFFNADKKRKYIVDAYGTIYGRPKKNKDINLIP